MRKNLPKTVKGYLSRLLFLGCLYIFNVYQSSAQIDQTAKGVVKNENGEPIIGATVQVKNTSNGTITDIEGRFNLNAQSSDTLIVSSIGYQPVELIAGNQTLLDIKLQEDIQQLSEVVVTALGIERDKKALGYSVQQVSGEDLNKVRTGNMLNALSGKVAGVQVTGANNGLASSSRFVIRGENSLNINNNSPLFVIDGTPVNNNSYGTGGNSTDQSNMPVDYGNGAAEVNPDDIASMSILKGAAATALYGSRAANGVIVITTKSGQDRNGFGVDISSSLLFSKPLVLPEMQKEYGGGWGLEYYPDYGTNFGPAFSSNQDIIQHGSPGFESGTPLPYVHRLDFDDFFETGVASNTNVSISGAFEKGNIKLAYGHSNNTGVVPNTDLKRDNFSINTSYKPAKNWTVNLSSTYIKSRSSNLPTAGYGGQGIMYALLWNYNNVDLNWLRDYWTVKDREQRNIFTWADNPFLIAEEHINAFDKDRLFGNISTSYQISPEFSLMLRFGTDNSSDFRWSRRPMGSVFQPNGMYKEQNIKFVENNADFLLSYNKRFGEFSTQFSVGGNHLSQKTSEGIVQGNGLAIPGIYTLANINVMPSLYRYDGSKEVNSLYAFSNIGYKDFLYLDITARNDWSSTLPVDNNSYFYPSAALSIVPTEIIQIWEPLDYLKVRFNVARVGKDTDPFQLTKTYVFSTLPNSLTTPDQLPNAALKPEQSDSYETGLEAYFFNRRLTADLSIYKTISTNQIISFAVSGASGYQSVFANAGKIENTGVELVLGAIPVQTNNLQWNVQANFSRNRGKVRELYQDLESYIIAQGPDGVTVEARPGGRMGDIYGNTYVRSNDGQIVYENGLPLVGPREKVGNYNPEWMLGISTGISYKNFNLSALVDIREGGIIYSYTHAVGTESGILKSSLPGREDGIIGDGVVLNPDGSYSPNTTRVSAEDYYYGGIYPRQNAEANSFDASYIKLRELSFTYRLPNTLINKVGIQGASVSLTGSNLALWTDVPNIDPEAQALNGGTLLPGFEVTQLPSNKSYGFKINLNF